MPPLRPAAQSFLDPRSNSYFWHAEPAYFVAERDGVIVGRVIAHIDHNLRRYQKNKWGLFGFFEAENDPQIAEALFDAAEGWLAERDCNRMVGPMEFSTNHSVGLRIQGHSSPPVLFEPWHPPYYQDLLEDQGLTKEIDAVWWEAAFDEVEASVREGVAELAAKATDTHGVTIRRMQKRNARADLMEYLRVQNATLTPNWGFVPLTETEIVYTADILSNFLDEKWAMLAESNGETVGAVVALPDYNQCLARLNGRLSPLGRVKFSYYKRKINQVRSLFMGVKPEYQHLGISAAFVHEQLKNADRYGFRRAHVGWTFETNEPLTRGVEAFGIGLSRRYRVYGKELKSDA